MTALQLAPGVAIPHRQLSRHLGIFGATGTGKTNSLAAVIERAPCPVLAIDAKGDLELAGTLHRPAMRVDALGPDLLTRALELSEAQSGALQVAFAWAADTGRAVVTLQDLRDLLSDTAATPLPYGLVSPASVAAVQRGLLRLERAVPWAFRDGAPDWRDLAGINVLGAGPLAHEAGMYGAMVAHVLDSLYRGLGELGDVPPGLMVVIDEAHLLFDGAPIAVTRRIEQITRLIRSKGVALVYVTQSPADLPDAILAQLGTRVQHGLRGATPRQQKAIRAAAETMPGQVTGDSIARLTIGQAWVSVAGRDAVRVQMPLSGLPMGQAEWIAPEPLPVEAVEAVEPEPPAKRPAPWWRFPAAVAALIYVPVLIETLMR